MKKYLLLLILNAGLLATSVCTAQPTLTQVGIAFAPGDMISTTSYYGNYLNPGSSGANQTWDLSTLPDSGTGTGNIVLASSLAISDSFPSANVALITGGSDLFYNSNSSVMQLIGTAAGTTVSFTYLDPEDQLHFPFSYTNTYVDPWRAITYGAYGARILSGTTSVTADGYGTVKTPNQTYTNAMRIHFVETYTDSNDATGTLFVFGDKVDSYKWYVEGAHYPVAEIDSSTLFYSGSPLGSTYSGSYLNGPTGLKNIEGINSFSAFPNPASDYLNLDLNFASTKKVEVKVFNTLGAEMEVPIIAEDNVANNRYQLDVKNFPQGIYFASINIDGVTAATRRFIVVR